MKLISTCAIVTLCVFVQVASAQYGVEDAPANKEENAKEEKVELDSRYGEGHGNRLNYLRRHRGERRNYEKKGGFGLKKEEELVINLDGIRSNRGNQNIESNEDNGIVQDIGVTNKVIPGYVQILPTVRSSSRERHDLRSQSNSYYRQNSASSVIQNNKRKQTFVHTHLNQLVYHPRHVDHIHKHHHTTFVKNLFPQIKKVYIDQKQKIIEPEKLTIVKYTQDASYESKTYPTKVQKAIRNEQLRTIRRPTLSLGVKNIGSPLDVDRLEVAGGERFEKQNRGGSEVGNNKNAYLNEGKILIEASVKRLGGKNRGRNYRNNAYGLNKRTDEQVEAQVAEAEPAAEVKVEAASDTLERRSANLKNVKKNEHEEDKPASHDKLEQRSASVEIIEKKPVLAEAEQRSLSIKTI